LELAEVAARIKINPKYLEAMEADDWKSLPGGFFYKSFVRQYAEALGLSAKQIEEALAGVPVEEAALPAPLPRKERSLLDSFRPLVERSFSTPAMRLLPSVGFLLAVVVGCSVLYSWWHRIENNARATQINRNVAALKTTPSPAPAVKVRRVQPPMFATPGQPQANAPRTGAAGQPPAKAAAASAVDPADGVHLTLAATEDTWVSVTADGRYVFSGVIKGQESRNIEGKENTRVRIGNAGGVQIEWNGRPIGSLGKKGEVRDVMFTRDSYKLIEKAPPAGEEAKPEATT
jgi:cytoskeletal protein RodZ